MSDFLQSVQASMIGQFMRENALAQPGVGALHVIAVTLLLSTIAIVDLRLLGLAAHRRSVRHLTHKMLPFTWAAFILAAVTGMLLFSGHAVDYVEKGPFRGKMLMLLLAGINMGIFHTTVWRRVADWDHARHPPAGARIAGGLSLLFWIGAIFAGRWISSA